MTLQEQIIAKQKELLNIHIWCHCSSCLKLRGELLTLVEKAKEPAKNIRQIERDMAVVYENFLKDNDITDPTLGYIHDLYAKLWNCVISIGPVYKPIYKHNISNTTDFKVEAKEQEEKPCPNCKETIELCACMRNICKRCGNPVGNITFAICDDCFDKPKAKDYPEFDKSYLDECMAKSRLNQPEAKEPDLNTPFFGNSGAKIPMKEVKSADINLRQILMDYDKFLYGYTNLATEIHVDEFLKTLEAEPEAKEYAYEPYFGWCDVSRCKNEGCSGGVAWRETGYWTVCSEHAASDRNGDPQPKMKQSAIKREKSRDKITGYLPAKPI